MLGNCEKMLLISSSSNEWPQQNNNQLDDPKVSFNNMASVASITGTVVGDTTRVMDHKVAAIAQDHQQQQQQQQLQQHQQQQQQQQQQKPGNQEVLRCPRCDSTNTKFCYYNNYSLSQPRHFCKACKRYWTRGGTLRNVPVGGGCRKNKRVKRPTNNSSSSSNNSNIEVSVSSASSGGGGGLNSLSSGGGGGGQIHDLISSSSNHVNHHHHTHPLFYGLPTNHSPNSDINFPFSRYDLQNPHQINGLGLGFSSGLVHNMNNMNIHPQNTKQIFQDLISSANNPMLSNYTNTTTTTTTSPTISSLLASSLHQMKGGNNNNNNNNNNFQTLLPSYEGDLHMKGNGQNGMFRKEVKMEFEGQNRSFSTNHHWNNNPSNQNQMDQNMSSSSDPSIIWGTSGVNLGAWLDPSNNNLGSSVPSLI